VLIHARDSAAVQLLATVQPAPAAPPVGGSIHLWIWAVLVLAVIVVGGYVLSLRR
jgi:hypothetical protein